MSVWGGLSGRGATVQPPDVGSGPAGRRGLGARQRSA